MIGCSDFGEQKRDENGNPIDLTQNEVFKSTQQMTQDMEFEMIDDINQNERNIKKSQSTTFYY